MSAPAKRRSDFLMSQQPWIALDRPGGRGIEHAHNLAGVIGHIDFGLPCVMGDAASSVLLQLRSDQQLMRRVEKKSGERGRRSPDRSL
jgi:hypothetical protein